MQVCIVFKLIHWELSSHLFMLPGENRATATGLPTTPHHRKRDEI